MIGTQETQSDFDKLYKGEILPADELIKLCEKVKPILTKEANIVSLKAPVTIVGDVHGQFWDLLEILKLGGPLPDTQYLFLGDYVNRGSQSLECISLLVALKVQYPDKVTLLRGNHECRSITKIYGFHAECLKQFGNEDVYNAFHEVFDCLPLAALVDDQFFCVHGGLSPLIQSLDDIKSLDRFNEVPQEGAICDLLWADPGTEAGWIKSPRGVSYTFGPNVSKKFNADNKLKLIVRAHQLVKEGYEVVHDNNVATIFSCANYTYSCGNQGGIMKIDAELKYSFLQYTQVKGKEEPVGEKPKETGDQ
mmetsp:Transcript_7824/g.8786  ORF Transcript_7824/g.8786 Transcript_7824/m.8786 type:complete len:307 (+) Transcript_7824:47-967(+)|eukprot:CAMPEP_0176431952 /NCGR_PEP_ID=MMETSP0127-20121128/15103_1 /TAXON_ID=938130 /ORGANISM="Platyophrya macrostoma, Strain WH" /LENGTH=306 /DNA_ID=CAMNT_0017814027 /DNA_START=47 /DNA_END=967 /DNA_ORIENTATION=-